MSGKSRFILKCLEFRKDVFKGKFQRVVYCYNQNDRSELTQEYLRKVRAACERVEIRMGIPPKSVMENLSNSLVILDDLAHILYKSPEIAEAFFLHSHHSNLR